MSLRHLRSSAGIMPGLSGATRVGRAVLVFLAFLFMVGQPVGAVRSEWDVGTPGKPEASGNGTRDGELPLESAATSDLTGPSEPTGPQDARTEEVLSGLGEETKGPEGSLEVRTLEQPIHQYSGPAGTPEGPGEEIGEAPMQQPTPEAPKKRRGPFLRLPQWNTKAKTGLKKAWKAFLARMRRAKEVAQRGVAKLMVRLPKVRRRRAARPKAPLHPLFPSEMELLKKVPECERVVVHLPSPLRLPWRLHPKLCFLWSLFNRDGMLSATRDKMVDLARDVANYLDAEYALGPEERDLEALSLRMQKRAAEGENDIARLAEGVDEACWFTEPAEIYRRADRWERHLLAAYSSDLSKANPCEMLKEVPSLLKMALKDGDSCWSKAEEEKVARQALRTSLGTAQKEISQLEASNGDKEAVAALVRDLGALQNREACSLVAVTITQEQSLAVMQWMELHKRMSFFSRKPEWYDERVQQCKRPARSATIIPSYFREPCDEFLSSPQPASSDDAAPRTAWLWEAASFRQPKEE